MNGQAWLTAAELAALKLPGLPTTKRRINVLAGEGRWADAMDRAGAPLARPRAGRGGGWEYSPALLPPEAQTALGRLSGVAQTSVGEPLPAAGGVTRWTVYERAPARLREEAQMRLALVQRVEALVAGGMTKTAAIATEAAAAKFATATVYAWFQLIAGIEGCDRLPALLPERRGGGAEAEVDPGAWAALKSDYLRLSGPAFSACVDRVLRGYCAEHGVTLPHAKTLRRKMDREVDPRVQIRLRKGAEAHDRTIPAQRRSVRALTAMSLVNIDGHKWDVFVRWPDGKIERPIMVCIQDVWSRKTLAWRHGRTESAELTRLAFSDLFRRWGVPKACLMDNGRAFASKAISGGSPTRFRYKVKPEDPDGLLKQLGITNHWATPHHGQAKPIERMFLDFTQIARHPAFQGAYTGGNPLAKPEDYQTRAIPFAEFEAVVAREIAAHNARPGRRTEAAAGRSFDQTFAEAYPTCGVGMAPEAVWRMALLAVEDKARVSKIDGSIKLYENLYWHPDLLQLAGERVMLRFDPDDLTAGVQVHRLDGSFVLTAALHGQAEFLDQTAAKANAKRMGELRRATRRAAELEGLQSAAELARLYARAEAPTEPTAPERRVVRLIHRGGAAAARKVEADAPAFMDNFTQAFGPNGRVKLTVVE